jgi:TonB family protein
MSQIGRALRVWSILAIAWATFWVPDSAFAQQAPGIAEGHDSTTPPAPDGFFEMKIIAGKELLVRKKGTQEWFPSSELSEPAAVGLLDHDHKIYVVTKSIKAAKLKHSQDPEYPERARGSGLEGVVFLHLVVDDKGKVREPTIDSTPNEEFAKAAIKAVNKWKFQPAELNSQPVAVLTLVQMYFRP